MLTFTRASTAMALACVAATAAMMGWMYLERPASNNPLTQKETQLSMPRAESLPLQLKMADRFAYRRIFALQDAGKWQEADALIVRLENPVLLLTIQAQRYLHPRYRSSVAELTAWLQKTPALAETPRIARLARRKGAIITDAVMYHPIKTPKILPRADRKTEQRFGVALTQKYLGWLPLRGHIADTLRGGRHGQALKILAQARGLTPQQYDLLRWMIASSLYNHGEYAQATALAAASANRSGNAIPELHWLAGMTAWHESQPQEAYRHFSQMAKSAPKLKLADAAAAAFWAYRTAKTQGNTANAVFYLKQAAATGDTFYGVQAGQLLATEEAAQAANQPLEGIALAALRKHYALDVMLALAEIGRHEDASAEWSVQFARASEAAKAPLMTLAGKLQLAGQNAVLEQINPQGYPRPAAFSAAQSGADPALLYAIIKQESGFNTQAESHRGASGAMQIMPDTAAYLRESAGHRYGYDLQNASTNIALGQAYLKMLGRQPHIRNNLIFMLAAYNAGPGILAKWLRERPAQEDPLLFIESIPYPETRSYVLQVLKNYWVYRSLMQQDNQPDLPQMLTGEWPRYAALEAQKVAMR